MIQRTRELSSLPSSDKYESRGQVVRGSFFIPGFGRMSMHEWRIVEGIPRFGQGVFFSVTVVIDSSPPLFDVYTFNSSVLRRIAGTIRNISMPSKLSILDHFYGFDHSLIL